MADDWLALDDKQQVAQLPAEVVMPTTYAERLALAESCWIRLTLPQRAFLQAWRDCRYNARAANRQLRGRDETSSAHTIWKSDPNYMTVMRIWLANAGISILDRDRLLTRHDDIVETLLTPKPILHQGAPTGFEEVDAGAAARANETLMRVAGMFPKEGPEVNVGVAFVPPSVEVVNSAGTTNEAIDAQFVEVSPALPEEDSDEVGADSGEVLPRQ